MKSNYERCENCGGKPAEPTDIDCEDGREIVMRLCKACIDDLNACGEFTRGKYKDWSQG
jgi:hypothetical protein